MLLSDIVSFYYGFGSIDGESIGMDLDGEEVEIVVKVDNLRVGSEFKVGICLFGKYCCMVWYNVFEIDIKYVLIKLIVKGVYGLLCLVRDNEIGE